MTLAKFSGALLVFFSVAVFAAEPRIDLKLGSPVDFGGGKATLTKLDALPFVDDDYTKRFKFDSFDNPKLKELRERYKLDEVVASGKDEFEKQVLLNDWTHQQFKKFGKPSGDPKGALEVLKSVSDGGTFFCTQFGEVLVSAAASMGWIDRPLALRRHQGVNKKGGSTEHTVTEIWSNQYRKWVMLDPTSNMYLEKDGVPLNAVELRQEWFYHDGKGLVFVIGKERKRYKKSDLPIAIPGVGNLTLEPDELDKYGFSAFVPNTNLMDAGWDYGKMFIVQDKLCDGTKWHVRTVPEHPETDPYFPIDQAALSLSVEGAALNVALKTMTPNFKEYRVQIDGGGWKASGDKFSWAVHPGANRIEAKAVNRFGVEGPVSLAEVEVGK